MDTLAAVNPSVSRRRSTPDRERSRMRLARAIAEAREEAGMTQTELGLRMNPIIPQKTMSRIEQGDFTSMGTGPYSRIVGLGIGLIVEFEQVLGMQPGHLATVGGYLPVAEPSVFLAIEADERLSEPARAALIAAYRHLAKG